MFDSLTGPNIPHNGANVDNDLDFSDLNPTGAHSTKIISGLHLEDQDISEIMGDIREYRVRFPHRQTYTAQSKDTNTGTNLNFQDLDIRGIAASSRQSEGQPSQDRFHTTDLQHRKVGTALDLGDRDILSIVNQFEESEAKLFRQEGSTSEETQSGDHFLQKFFDKNEPIHKYSGTDINQSLPREILVHFSALNRNITERHKKLQAMMTATDSERSTEKGKEKKTWYVKTEWDTCSNLRFYKREQDILLGGKNLIDVIDIDKVDHEDHTDQSGDEFTLLKAKLEGHILVHEALEHVIKVGRKSISVHTIEQITTIPDEEYDVNNSEAELKPLFACINEKCVRSKLEKKGTLSSTIGGDEQFLLTNDKYLNTDGSSPSTWSAKPTGTKKVKSSNSIHKSLGTEFSKNNARCTECSDLNRYRNRNYKTPLEIESANRKINSRNMLNKTNRPSRTKKVTENLDSVAEDSN